MDGYIDRKSLMENIHETVLFTVRENEKLPTAQMRGANKVIDRILRAPAADVVEVVRCKNCIHWGGVTFGNICRRWSAPLAGMKNCTQPDDFCSCGERRDGV
jgi:hypothetical protein